MINVSTFEDLWAKLEKDPEFRKVDRQIKPYYDLLIEIIRRRQELNITRAELAERAGIRQSYVARLESAEHNARLDTIIKVAEALDAHLEIHLVPNDHVKSGNAEPIGIETMEREQ